MFIYLFIEEFKNSLNKFKPGTKIESVIIIKFESKLLLLLLGKFEVNKVDNNNDDISTMNINE